MINSKFLILLSFTVLFSCQDKATKNEAAPKAEQVSDFSKMEEPQKIAYALGYKYAEGTAELELSESDQKIFFEGAKSFFKSKKSAGPELNYYARKIDEIVREKRKKLSEQEKKSGEDFVAKILAEGEFKQSDSGLLYKVTKQGQKISKVNDQSNIKMNYTSHYLDDEQYESTLEGNPRVMAYRGLLKAWQEALKIAGVGGSIEIIAPPELTYGVHGAMPKIKPGQYLKFKMNFFEVINKK